MRAKKKMTKRTAEQESAIRQARNMAMKVAYALSNFPEDVSSDDLASAVDKIAGDLHDVASLLENMEIATERG